ncbi:MAG: hypothetical protein RTV41_08945 [Candidatus Thorarchaeota archaeon]
MKYKCKDCGFVGPPAYPPPAASSLGDKYQKIPVCSKCGSEDVYYQG